MNRKSLGASSLGLIASVLGACSLAPKYESPATEEITRYKEAGDWSRGSGDVPSGDWIPARPADTQQRGSWWEVFGDPKLDELEKQLNVANPDLHAAVARCQ